MEKKTGGYECSEECDLLIVPCVYIQCIYIFTINSRSSLDMLQFGLCMGCLEHRVPLVHWAVYTLIDRIYSMLAGKRFSLHECTVISSYKHISIIFYIFRTDNFSAPTNYLHHI